MVTGTSNAARRLEQLVSPRRSLALLPTTTADVPTHSAFPCTDCHRGANAFITHPGSSLHLETSVPFSLSFWVRPIVPDSWFQNPQEG